MLTVPLGNCMGELELTNTHVAAIGSSTPLQLPRAVPSVPCTQRDPFSSLMLGRTKRSKEIITGKTGVGKGGVPPASESLLAMGLERCFVYPG